MDRQGWIGNVPRFEQTAIDLDGKPIYRHRRLKTGDRCDWPGERQIETVTVAITPRDA